ncbi:MAG: SGNH/GDSL hydrolase family protein [Actinomycetota bacterium]|nr:SGNH/GDSL hydrolase family protein [Actinomycetota bacterium]
MSRASRARRIAVAAAYGGGTVGAAGAALVGVLAAQAQLARRTVGEPTTVPPVADGIYRPAQASGEDAPLTLALLGDSSAAGLGVELPEQTPGALLAGGLAELAGRPVRLVNAALVGAQSSQLLDQVAAVLLRDPDVAVIMVGANDVTHRVRPVNSVRHLAEAVRALRAAGVKVVVGTCPDLGTVEPIGQPLRLVARRWSRMLAAAQTIAAVEAGGRSVSLGDLLGPEFTAAPRVMFSADRFHPSASGYARLASTLLPSVAAMLEAVPQEYDEPPVVERGEAVSSLTDAAAQAAEVPGTEVAGTEVGGREHGPWGRWAVLRHRIRRGTRRPAGPQPEELVR